VGVDTTPELISLLVSEILRKYIQNGGQFEIQDGGQNINILL